MQFKNTEDQFMGTFVGNGIRTASELIILPQYCVGFVEACAENNIAIIGIDGFFLPSDGTNVPNMNEIADFSDLSKEHWSIYLPASIVAAKRFIGTMLKVGKSHGYSFVIDAGNA